MAELKDIMENDRLAAFRKAWEDARSGRAIPARRDITLRAFSRFIPDMLMLEQRGARDYAYCQAGEGVKDRMEMHDTGANFFDFLHPAILDMSEDWWGGLLALPCGGYVSYSIEYPGGALRHAVTMMLPMDRDNGSHKMLLGLTHVLGERYFSNGRGKTVIGEHWAEATHFDIGFGVPNGRAGSNGTGYSHKPDPDFLMRLSL